MFASWTTYSQATPLPLDCRASVGLVRSDQLTSALSLVAVQSMNRRTLNVLRCSRYSVRNVCVVLKSYPGRITRRSVMPEFSGLFGVRRVFRKFIPMYHSACVGAASTDSSK
jgi:hypothetical protein